MSQIFTLPTEVLLDIFFLYVSFKEWPVLAQVASWTHFIVKKCWERLRVADLDEFPLVRPAEFERLALAFVALKDVRINCFYLKNKSIRNLPLAIESLSLINADTLIAKREEFIETLFMFNHLTTLRIKCLDLGEKRLSFQSFSSFLNRNQVKVLDIQKVFLKGSDSFSEISFPKSLVSLKTLNHFSSSLPINLKTFKTWKLCNSNCWGLNNETLIQLSYYCPNLESFSVIDKSNDVISSNSLKVLVQNCKKLKKLKLSRRTTQPIKSINDFAAMFLSTQTNSLRYLNLDSFQKLSDAGCIEILSNNPSLTGLSLSYTFITDDTLASLFSHSIEKLSLRNCKRVSSAGLIKLLSNLPNLQSLDLGNTHGVEEEVFETIEKTCKKLKNLVLISPDFPEKLSLKLEDFKDLQGLTIENTPLQDFSFLQNLWNLKFLSLARSEGLSGPDLEGIGRRLPALRKLKLCGCSRLTESDILNHLPSVKDLRALDLRGVRMSSNIISNLPRFKNLQVLKTSELKVPKEVGQVQIIRTFKVLIEKNGERSFVKFCPSSKTADT